MRSIDDQRLGPGEAASAPRAIQLETSGPEETAAVGYALGTALQGGEVVTLRGPLGAGKTCLARGLARGLGVPGSTPITSPTFTLVQVYEAAEVELAHFDLYRVSDEEELEAVGFRDYLADDAVVLVEWPERASGALPGRRLEIELGGSGDRRAIRLVAVGWTEAAWRRVEARVVAGAARLSPEVTDDAPRGERAQREEEDPEEPVHDEPVGPQRPIAGDPRAHEAAGRRDAS